MHKLLLTAALGFAIGGAAAAPSLAADVSGATPQQPSPLEHYLGHHTTTTAEQGAAFVGQTAGNEPVVGRTAGPPPQNPLSPEALASAAVAAPENGAVAEAPKPPAQ